jgi:methylase of polypeptide subunit release factors
MAAGVAVRREKAKTMNLLEIGTAAQFDALSGFLADAGYRESRICEKLGLASAEALDIVALSDNLKEKVASPEPLNTLIKLFLLGEFVSVAEVEAQFPGRAWAAMNAMGLIEDDPADRKRCSGSVALYPVGDLFIVSDRWSNPDRKPKQSFPDIVYPALTKSTREFLRFLPNNAQGNFLELCGGSGIAALAASRTAQHAWASDITERSTRFAEFNTALNSANNVSAVQGDLYSAVEGRTFDCIAAHPPYMPVLRPAEIYFDGGEDGEQLTRRIVEGLRQHLNPGGRLYCRTLGTDREDLPFEQRLRAWLGEAESEFDIAVFVSKNLDPVRFATDSAIRRSTGQAEMNQWKALFERLRVKEILTGMIVVQRRDTKRRVFTIRRSLAPNVDSGATERVLHLETELAGGRSLEKIFGMRPIASPRAELIVRHRIEGGDFTPQDFTLSNDYPFLMDCKVQPWMGYLLVRCDGSKSVEELYGECREAGWIDPNTPRREFVELIALLISGGFLSVEEIRQPAATE